VLADADDAFANRRAIRPAGHFSDRISGEVAQDGPRVAMQNHDLSARTDDEIETWIANHEKRKAVDSPLYRALLEERARRFAKGLSVEVSLAHLVASARARRFTTYGDLAKANGMPWEKARHLMNGAHGHLDRLLDVCHARGLPLLTGLCVNQQGERTGELSPEALEGFARGARRIGRPVPDPREFLRRCQAECFDWAERTGR
jgi:hypothetical protein